MKEYIENKTFDEIKVGETAELVHTMTQNEVDILAAISGDINPSHMDKKLAESDSFHKTILHGTWGNSLISTVLGTELPGPGTTYIKQSLNFKKPLSVGETVTIKVTAHKKDTSNHTITFLCTIKNQNDEEVTGGNVVVQAPTKKIRRARVESPLLALHQPGELYKDLLKLIQDVELLKTAVVHPVDEVSLLGAIEAAQARLIIPILVGPESKIHAVAKKLKIDLSPYELISTPHSDAAAEKAVSLAREGKVGALMKGDLHTDELMHAVVNKETGIQTDRRMSHIFVMDVPTYPRFILVSDAAINIYPTLDDKKDIVQNAIDLAIDIGIEMPKVAILSAVETVTSKIQSTIDAAALCKMADRGQIKGGILDGPLAFDNVISKEAAKIKGIHSPVSGKVNVVITPDLESGNILVKQLEYLSEAQSAGVVLGAKVPIILTSRSDKPITRLASSALAAIIVHKKFASKDKQP